MAERRQNYAQFVPALWTWKRRWVRGDVKVLTTTLQRNLEDNRWYALI